MRKKATFFAFVAALGGFLFGFNTSIISPALLFMTPEFGLTRLSQEMVVSILLVGALIGALTGGILADRFGRKRALGMTIVLFIIGSLILFWSQGIVQILVARFILGWGVGLTSLVAPLYIAEIAPPDHRGTLVSLNQFLITVGILFAYWIGYVYGRLSDWRDMILIGMIPAALQGLLLLFIPETHSWQIHAHQLKTGKSHYFEEWGRLFHFPMRKPFLIGITVSGLQQLTGINTVIYYAPQIFTLAGKSVPQEALLATFFVGAINVIVTLFALWLIDRVGRRPLMICGLIGMGMALLSLGIAFFYTSPLTPTISLISLMLYISFFALSLGPCAWLIISEIYPRESRGRAMGVATSVNWLCNYLVSLTFLSLLDLLGASNTFWLYSLICALGIWFVWKFLPETKGKTLEEIQVFWKKGVS